MEQQQEKAMMNTIIQNPYIGPRMFTKEEKHLFFGRDREARDLTALVATEKVVLFYAQSGSGKSSLINTKLIPELEHKEFEVLPVARVSGYTTLDTGIENIYIYNLFRSLLRHDIDSKILSPLNISQFLDKLNEDEQGYFFDDSIKVSVRSNPEIVPWSRALIIDQFEEIFSTNVEAWQKREDFFCQLAQAMRDDPYLWVILVMREDHIAALDPYAHLMPGGLRVRYYMERLSHDAAIEAVRYPVKSVRPYAPGVAEKLVDDLRGVQVGYQPDGTPDIQPGQYVEPVQLQVACANLWNKLQPGDQITEQDLQEIGDVNKSLGDFYAERVSVVALQQKVNERKIRDWFTDKLISPGGVRTPVLKERDGSSGGLEGNVIEALHDLVRAEQRGGATFYELTHDRLVVPIVVNNQTWRQDHYNPLQRQAKDWSDQEKDAKWLLKEEALQDVEDWASLHPDEVTELEKEFLEACRRKQDEAKLIQQEQAARRLRRNIAVVSILACIAMLAAIVATIFGAQANQAAATANAANTLAATSVIALQTAKANADSSAAKAANSAKLAEAGKLAVQSQTSNDQQLRILLAIEAIKQAPSGEETNILEAYDALRKTYEDAGYRKLKGHFASVNVVSFSPDHHWLASGSNDNTIRLWDITGQALNSVVLNGQNSPARFIVFSPDNRELATVSYDNTIRIWDLTHPTSDPISLAGNTGTIHSLVFSPDKAHLTGASDNGTVWRWDLTNPSSNPVSLSENTGLVSLPTFSPTGRWLASIYPEALGDGNSTRSSLYIRDITNPESEPITLSGFTNTISSLAFSLDESLLAAASDNGTVLLWDVANPTSNPIQLTGNTNTVNSLTFSPDGRWLASGVADGTVLIWKLKLQNPSFNPIKLSGTAGPVYSLAFSEDGHWLASGNDDTTVRIWDTTTLFGIETLVSIYDVEDSLLTSNADPIKKLSFSPDGIWLTSVDSSNKAQIWNFQSGIPAVAAVNLDKPVYSFMYDPQSSVLYAGGDQQDTLYSWSLGKEYPESNDIKIPGHKGVVNTLAYSSCQSGGCWASANNDSTVTYWTGSESITLHGKANEEIKSLAISPDNRWLADGSNNGTVSVWNLRVEQGNYKDLASRSPYFLYQKGEVNDLTFSRDSQWLAGASQDGTTSIWDLGGENIPSQPTYQFQNPDGPINTLTFSARGRWLASGGAGAKIRLWDLANPESEPYILESNNHSVNALAFSSDGRWLASGGDNGKIQIWGPKSNELSNQACQAVGRNLEWQEWKSYFSGETPYKITCPTNPFPESVAEHFLRPGDQLARGGEIQEAVAQYRQAVQNCPETNCPGFFSTYIPDPLARANHQRAQFFVDDGDSKARDGDAGGAIEQYREALKLDPKILADNETPESRVDLINNTVLKQELLELYYAGNYSGAAARLREAQALNPDNPIMTREDAELVNGICWFGSVKSASEVQDMCQLLAILAPENGNYRDSIGVNRAILGDLTGAIKDFEFAVQWWTDNKTGSDWILERKAWIRLLENGHNPFVEKMVFIPAGEFTMGNENSRENEKPAHIVYLDAFLIDQTEVTNKMYAQCVEEGGCMEPKGKAPPNVLSYYGDPKYDNYPVIYIDWKRAKDYCTWAGRRLPTEAEWEKAARGINAYLYPWGNHPPDGTLLNYFNPAFHVTEVGSYPAGASPYGVLDMAGNVWEWVSDYFSEIYYAQPNNSKNPQGPRVTDTGILRGGGWDSTRATVGATYRNSQGRAGANSSFGFRCALSIP